MPIICLSFPSFSNHHSHTPHTYTHLPFMFIWWALTDKIRGVQWIERVERMPRLEKFLWKENYHLHVYSQKIKYLCGIAIFNSLYFLSAREKLWWTQQAEENCWFDVLRIVEEGCVMLSRKVVAFNLFYVDSITRQNFT